MWLGNLFADEAIQAMHLEIERKFLVTNDGWKADAVQVERLRDGLIASVGGGKVRVRRAADRAWLTVKGPRTGRSRAEYEYEIPLADADELLRTLCVGAIIEKVRHCVPYRGRTWAVDVHEGPLADLTLVEVELGAEDEILAIPEWVGREITADPAFKKEALLQRALAADSAPPAY